jgi:oxygen-dependent protoporphyrinogen oxidase
VADFARRRLGTEMLEYVVDPFVTSKFAGNPEQLSARYAFPSLYELEQQYGSLIKGQVKRTRQSKHRNSVSGPSTKTFSFLEGIQTLTDALHARLCDAIRLNASVRSLQQTASGWVVTATEKYQPTTELFNAVLYTGPLYQLPAIGLKCTDDVRLLSSVYYPPLSILVLGFKREDVRHPLDGLGMLVPAVEPFNILGALFSSTMFPGRAPEAHVTLTTFIGGTRNPALARTPTQKLLEVALQDLHTILGAIRVPNYVKHIFWEQAIPQYDLGFGRLQDIMSQMETRHPGFFMAGNYRQGTAVGDALTSGYEAAERIAGMLGKP